MPKIEQNHELLTFTSGGSNTSYATSPVDLGNWKYTASYTSPTIYYEVFIKINVGTNTAYASLYTTGGSAVSNSEISTTSTSYVRLRSSAISLVDGTTYTPRLMCSAGSWNVQIARVVIQQEEDQIINTESSVLLNQSQDVTSSSYADFTNYRRWYYDSSVFVGTNTFYYESTLYISSASGTAATLLRNISDSSDVAGSEITTSSTTPTLVRSSALTLTTAKEYSPYVRRLTTGTATFRNTRVVIVQANASKTESVRVFHPYLGAGSYSGTTYASFSDDMDWTDTAWSSQQTHYYEAVINTGNALFAGFSRLLNRTSTLEIGNSEISTTSLTKVRVRSSALNWPTGSFTYRPQLRIEDAATSVGINSFWHIVQTNTVVKDLIGGGIIPFTR